MINFIKFKKTLFAGIITAILFFCSMGNSSADNNSGDLSSVTGSGAVIELGDTSGLAEELGYALNKAVVKGGKGGKDKVDDSIDSDSVIAIDMNSDISAEDVEFMNRANESEVTFVIKNAKKEMMKGFALITAEGDTVIIASSLYPIFATQKKHVYNL